MTHKGILDNFSFRFLVKSLDEELGEIIFHAKCYRHLKTPEEELSYILEQLMPRWNLMFDSDDFSDLYKSNTYITIATYLNKYGYQDKNILQNAVDRLTKIKNDIFGILPSHQYKKAEKAIEFLETPVTYHTKKPWGKQTVTQYRKGDVFSIKFSGYYCAGIINEVIDRYEAVDVLTYEKIFSHEPTINDLKDIPFLRRTYYLYNLNYIPDPAGQFKLIENIKWETSLKHNSSISYLHEYLSDLVLSKIQ